MQVPDPKTSLEQSPSEIALQVQQLSKHYSTYASSQQRLTNTLFGWGEPGIVHVALDQVSLQVKRGQSVGIIGRNGAGKSTLLQILVGALTPTQGSVHVQGKMAALLELGAGFNAEFTGRENVFLNGALYGLSAAQMQQRFDQIAAFADIGDYIDQPIRTYSSGMVVRLAFAVIAHVDAEILIVDEALAVGDAFFTQKCMRFFRQFREHGTLLFVSHDNGAVSALCDRVIWLDAGRVRMDNRPEVVIPAYLKFGYQDPSSDNEIAENQSIEPTRPSNTSTQDKHQWLTPAKSEADFGEGGALLDGVFLERTDQANTQVNVVQGNEHLRLRIRARFTQAAQRPLFGFYLKNRLGQLLFSANSDQVASQEVQADTHVCAQFEFAMPVLGDGEYVIAIAVGEGFAHGHQIMHWMHDAWLVRVTSGEAHALMKIDFSCVIQT